MKYWKYIGDVKFLSSDFEDIIIWILKVFTKDAERERERERESEEGGRNLFKGPLKFKTKLLAWNLKQNCGYVEIKCQLDATDVFIADLIACSTCFRHHYAHHQELESIIQMVAACGIWCFGFQVVVMVWS